MMNIGRVCVKIAGREAGSIAVVVDAVDKNFVIIDGAVKRRKCNLEHLEPTNKVIDIKKGAEKKEVVDKLVEAGLIPAEFAGKLLEKKTKTPSEKPISKRAQKKAEKKAERKPKKTVKKEEPKEEKKAEEKTEKKAKAPAKKTAKKAPSKKKEE